MIHLLRLMAKTVNDPFYKIQYVLIRKIIATLATYIHSNEANNNYLTMQHSIFLEIFLRYQ